MTELEKEIYQSALEVLPDLKKVADGMEAESRYVEMPFYSNGVADSVIYDTILERFVRIKYTKGIGSGVEIESFGDGSIGYFSNVEYCSFDLPEDINEKI